jgi:tRNA 2-selenouridine synthase
VCIVGGRTGVGKTRALLALRDLGAQVIDLEGLAAHSGSAFGWVGRPARQPTSEHFGNLVACAWSRLSPAPAWVFIEDEGPHVGKCSVDPGLFKRMRHAPLVINVVAPERVRLRTLTRDYASPESVADPGWLPAMTESVGKLAKRLGGKRASELSERLREGEYAAVAEGLLEYYDGLYDRHLGNKRVDRRKEGGGRTGEKEKGETKGGDGDATDAEEEARGGKTVVVHANGIGPEGDELDAETLAREILEVTRAFDAEEEADASREVSDD